MAIERQSPAFLDAALPATENRRNPILKGASMLKSIHLTAIAAMLGLAIGLSSARGDDEIVFNRDIRPILADTCLKCHGPDSATRQADLRLDQADAAIERGAWLPGDPDNSEAIRRVFSTDPDEMMPPPSSHKVLTPEQKELLKKWVAAGAEYQPHWAFIAPQRPALPEVTNKSWPANPIDFFVLAKLEAAGLSPAPEADRRTLARRVALDLTGLPPSPQAVEEFVNDASPSAYEAYVDRLLDSPEWGEHRGRYWLDAARYADTHGIHFDNYREIWAYRDWVIGAFNRNMPFDQFTIEQLAGDLLPNRTIDQQIASGFNRCNITTSEGGAIDEEYLVLYTRDRTETTSQVWMGLTTGCAVCHDHKFDPLAQREFYELSAFFNNTTQRAMDGNIKDTPPIINVPMASDREAFVATESQLAEAKSRLEARRQAARPDFEAWLAAATAESLGPSVPADRLHFRAGLAEGQGKSIAIERDQQPLAAQLSDSASWKTGPMAGSALECQGQAVELPEVGDFEKDQPFSAVAWIKLPANDIQGAICARMDNTSGYRGWDFWSQQRRVGAHIIDAWPNNALKVVSQAQVPANEWTHVAVTYDGQGKAAGVKIYYNGRPQETLVEADQLSGTIRTSVPFKIGQRHASEPLSGVNIHDLRIYRGALAPAEVESLAKTSRFADILKKPAEQRTDAEKNEMYPWWLGSYDAAFQTATSDVAAHEKTLADIRSRGTIAHVMQESNATPAAFILFRGEYDKRRDEVRADTPDILPPMSDDLPRDRLGLAKWLLAPEHPLTARVTVNRFWQEVFGTGLVRTAGDFGGTGELPSNQELLDWLAVEFRESGWNVKEFFKRMVMSATYRQAAVTTPEKLAADRDNRLLSRGPRFRMDAEMVRDYALAASGLLVKKIGGPSVKPYQPEGVWEAVAMIGSNTRDYKADNGDGLYRRSMYTFWKRSAPPASMDIFNAPSRETCTVRRERTNTPLQALVTLNDPQFVEAARHLAQAAVKHSGDDNQRLDYVTARILARPLKADERPIVLASLAELLAHYQGHADDAKALLDVGESPADATLDAPLVAAWTMTVNELLNLDEVLNK
jgi:hypothetical protein